MKETELPFLSVAALSVLIRRREASPVEVAEAHLRRIEALNPRLRAYVTVAADAALKQAREAEDAVAAGKWRGPMHGIPVALKDQIWTRDMPTSNGSTLLKDFAPARDAAVVTRLKENGAVILGKLHMGEFAGGGAFGRPFPPAINPWNAHRATGGSSSGSAVAVAARLCATALGEDTGGSIRSPASFCGVVGLRPTWGRVSRSGVFAVGWSMDAVGPMSRTVEDCAITLDAIAEPEPRDTRSAAAPRSVSRAALGRDPKGVKVGLVRELTSESFVAPEVKRAVVKAADHLAGLGAEVREVSIPLAPFANLIMMTILYVESAAIYLDWARRDLVKSDADVPATYKIGRLIPAQAYYKAQKLRSLVRRQVLQALGEVDLLLSPTVSTVAPPAGAGKAPANKEEAMEGLLRPTFILTPAYALAGIPAVSLPCGFTPDPGGVPIGLQIGGRPFDEASVLSMAFAYEQSTPWHRKIPSFWPR